MRSGELEWLPLVSICLRVGQAGEHAASSVCRPRMPSGGSHSACARKKSFPSARREPPFCGRCLSEVLGASHKKLLGWRPLLVTRFATHGAKLAFTTNGAFERYEGNKKLRTVTFCDVKVPNLAGLGHPGSLHCFLHGVRLLRGSSVSPGPDVM